MTAKKLASLGIPGIRYLDQDSNYHDRHLRLIADSRANWVKMRDHQPPDMVKRIGKMSMEAWHKHVDAQIAFWDKELAGLSDEEKRLTRNYVVFDPKTLTVTHRNGQPIDGGASDAILAGDDFNPSEPRKEDGEWTSGGGSAAPFSKASPPSASPIISSRNVTAKRSYPLHHHDHSTMPLQPLHQQLTIQVYPLRSALLRSPLPYVRRRTKTSEIREIGRTPSPRVGPLIGLSGEDDQNKRSVISRSGARRDAFHSAVLSA